MNRLVGLFCVLLSTNTLVLGRDWSANAGRGSAGNPYQISTAEQLASIRSNPNLLDKHFVLTNDIDMDPAVSGMAVFTAAVIAPDTGVTVAGDFRGAGFGGVFDGNGHKITNLIIDKSTGSDSSSDRNGCLSLFGRISPGGEIRNLRIENISITGGHRSGGLGGLCAENYGAIRNCYVGGRVTGGNGGGCVGGLCGLNAGIVSDCYVTASVNGENEDMVGGVIGWNLWDTISACKMGGRVTGRHYVGGVCGCNEGTLYKCCAGADVSGEGWVGGLCGNNYDIILNSYATGSVIGRDTACYVGGLCGNSEGGLISGCYATGNVTTGGDYVGGLCGEKWYGRIRYCHAAGSVTGNNCVGGLCGQSMWGVISECYATGDVTGGDLVGGLCGQSGDEQGVIISSCYATGSVSGNRYVGGLCGWNDDVVSYCYAAGSVDGNDCVGGLCARNLGGTLSYCCASGSVTGGTVLGGLCGHNHGPVSACYATGSVSGDDYVGGLCAKNSGATMSNCYATGSVSGGAFFGGLCGNNDKGSFANCFWDTDTSGLNTSDGGTGLTTAQMQQASTYINAGWDFVGETANGGNDIWTIKEAFDYPKHVWVIVNFVGWDGVDFKDYRFFAERWRRTDCSAVNDCGQTDLDFSGSMDGNDLNIFATHWLSGK